MFPSPRVAIRRALSVPAALACLTLASCGQRQPQLSVAQFTAIQQRLEAQSAADPAPASAPASAAAAAPSGSGARPAPAAGSPSDPPKDDAARRARAAGAVAPGVKIGALVPVGNGTRWAIGLASAERDGSTVGPNLVLFDVSTVPGALRGEHDFGLAEPGAKPPAKLGRALYLDASPEDPVVLVELLGDDETQGPLGACGWWLRARKSTFLCAPRLTPQSGFEVNRGQLVESWSVDSAGATVAGKATTRSGRKLRFVEGQWQETDSFRCLARPLDEAFKEAGARPLRDWQKDAVLRLTKAASRAADGLETDVAISRLDDAMAIDGCSPEVWRLLGRLQFEAGRPRAAATLAVALLLAPRDDAALIDLADALAVLDPAKPEQRESWHTTLAVLGGKGSTRAFVEGAAGKSPRATAAALYRAFLTRTAGDEGLLTARRTKVEQKLDTLEGAGRKR